VGLTRTKTATRAGISCARTARGGPVQHANASSQAKDLRLAFAGTAGCTADLALDGFCTWRFSYGAVAAGAASLNCVR
jgi:hypothetical protein